MLRAPRALAPPPLFDSLEQEAYLQLWRTYDRLREIDDRLFAGHGITAQQYNALRVLKAARPGALSASALGTRLVSRAADITRLLDRLERLALVQRRRNDRNRRAVEVSITSAGVALVDRLAEAVRRCGRDQLGHLDRRSLRQLVDLLERARAPHEAAGHAAAWPARAPQTAARRPPRGRR